MRSSSSTVSVQHCTYGMRNAGVCMLSSSNTNDKTVCDQKRAMAGVLADLGTIKTQTLHIFVHVDATGAQLPGTRTRYDDWVLEGMRIER